eukprot:scaffold240310_cov26-Tisochrysis_lutea.AAC.3
MPPRVRFEAHDADPLRPWRRGDRLAAAHAHTALLHQPGAPTGMSSRVMPHATITKPGPTSEVQRLSADPLLALIP